MASLIKNSYMLPQDFIPETTISKIEELKKNKNIIFKIVGIHHDELTLSVRQEKNHSGDYESEEELTKYGQSLFGPLFKTLRVWPETFQESPVGVVDSEYIRNKMDALGLSSKLICQETGIAKTELSGMLNGHRPIGMRTRGLFFYYFIFKELNKKA